MSKIFKTNAALVMVSMSTSRTHKSIATDAVQNLTVAISLNCFRKIYCKEHTTHCSEQNCSNKRFSTAHVPWTRNPNQTKDKRGSSHRFESIFLSKVTFQSENLSVKYGRECENNSNFIFITRSYKYVITSNTY